MLHGYDLIEFPYHVDDLVLVVPQHHPLATRERVFFQECLDYPHVGLHTASAINLEIMRAASLANKTLRIRIQVTSYDALCLMVQAGLGVGVLPRGGDSSVRGWAQRDRVTDRGRLGTAQAEYLCQRFRPAFHGGASAGGAFDSGRQRRFNDALTPR